MTDYIILYFTVGLVLAFVVDAFDYLRTGYSEIEYPRVAVGWPILLIALLILMVAKVIQKVRR